MESKRGEIVFLIFPKQREEHTMNRDHDDYSWLILHEEEPPKEDDGPGDG